MGTCTGYYGPCDHTACHSSVLLSALVPLPLSCRDSGGDPGKQTSERKTATVRGVWKKNKAEIDNMAERGSRTGSEDEEME